MEQQILEIVKKVEDFEIELEDADPTHYEKEYIDGASEYYIIHKVRGLEIEVVFTEHTHIKNLRDDIYKGIKTDEDFDDLVIQELSNQYDYGKVVAYRVDIGPLEWIV